MLKIFQTRLFLHLSSTVILQFQVKFTLRVFIIPTKYLSLLRQQFTMIQFSRVTFCFSCLVFSFAQFCLSVSSSSSVKCFSVQFSTWSNLSHKLTTSTYSCSHPSCSCPSCFILDCVLFRPAAKLLSWDILGIFFTCVESLFSWIPCLPFSLFLLFGFSTINCERVHEIF